VQAAAGTPARDTCVIYGHVCQPLVACFASVILYIDDSDGDFVGEEIDSPVHLLRWLFDLWSEMTTSIQSEMAGDAALYGRRFNVEI